MPAEQGSILGGVDTQVCDGGGRCAGSNKYGRRWPGGAVGSVHQFHAVGQQPRWATGERGGQWVHRVGRPGSDGQALHRRARRRGRPPAGPEWGGRRRVAADYGGDGARDEQLVGGVRGGGPVQCDRVAHAGGRDLVGRNHSRQLERGWQRRARAGASGAGSQQNPSGGRAFCCRWQRSGILPAHAGPLVVPNMHPKRGYSISRPAVAR